MTFSRSFEVISVATLLLAAACSAPKAAEKPERLDGIATSVAAKAGIPDVYETTGTVRAKTTSNLAAKVMGNVTHVLVSEGDSVRRGQLLIQIDPREADAQLQKASAGAQEVDGSIAAAAAAESAAAANATLAESTLRRYSVLKDRGSVSPHEFEQIESQQKAAAADLQRARATHQQLIARRAEARADVSSATTFAGYDEIRSPVDGVVTAKFVDAGSQASPGMTLMTVEDTTGSRVEAFVPENVMAQLHPGDAAEIQFDQSAVSAGRVTQVVPALDPATRTALVKLSLAAANAAQSVRSGQTVRVRFAIGQRSAVVVPDDAIFSRGQLQSVYVVDENGIARMRLVTLGRSFQGSTEILSGLDSGEHFVTKVSPRLRDGLQIADASKGGLR